MPTAEATFDPAAFQPTQAFQNILDTIDPYVMPAPVVAAGVLAYFITGDDFEQFVTCLKQDGLTREGMLGLGKAALDLAIKGVW